jgi:hypothetical protein
MDDGKAIHWLFITFPNEAGFAVNVANKMFLLRGTHFNDRHQLVRRAFKSPRKHVRSRRNIFQITLTLFCNELMSIKSQPLFKNIWVHRKWGPFPESYFLMTRMSKYEAPA